VSANSAVLKRIVPHAPAVTPPSKRLPVARYVPFTMAVGDVLPVFDIGSPLTLRVGTNLLVAVETYRRDRRKIAVGGGVHFVSWQVVTGAPVAAVVTSKRQTAATMAMW